MKSSRPVIAAVGAIALVSLLSACGASNAGGDAAADDKTITVGFNPGPYQQQWTEGIAPILEKEGYTVESKEFTDGIQINVALDQGDIDATIMQHQTYLDFVNEQENLDGAMLVTVPTPPMGVYAGKRASLDAVQAGDIVSVPSEPANLYRALTVLQDIGWVTLDPDTEPGTTSLKNVVDNSAGVELKLMDNAQQARALQDVGYAVIQGNFAVSSGMKLSDALQLEQLTDRFSVGVTVRADDLDSDWANAVSAAYSSQEFASYIADDADYTGYHLPDALAAAGK